ITVALNHLIKNDKYKVYGNWVCREWNCQHKPQCRDKWACQREWEYRNKMQCKHKPKCRNGDKCRYNQCICPNSWWRPRHAEYCQEAWVTQNNWNCKHLKKCNDRQNCQHETKSKDDEWKKPDLEIVCHLVWNNFYRVFGDWKCNNCKASWESAYTWISLQKFIEKTRGGDLIKEDFYVVESCKEKLCKRLESTSILKEFKPLTQSKSKKLPHRRDLCQKCLHYENCTQTGVYFGYQNSQKK
ncbi:10379_t:CDS:2, partial [Entrophospora sp. SA101]